MSAADRNVSSIAWFVSPHGLGHAARAAAIMVAMRERLSSIVFDIFTLVPSAFFEQSGVGEFRYHEMLTDVGVVQNCALREDIAETVSRLDVFLPFDEGHVFELAGQLKQLGSSLVVADIAPLGLAAARAAGIPSVLVENFTWDWIYEGYAQLDHGMTRHVKYLAKVFAGADCHVQTEPVARQTDADMVSPPVSRKPRMPRIEVHRQLGIPPDRPAVLITMGGIPEQHGFLEELKKQTGVHFVVPGAGAEPVCDANLVLLPLGSFYHPDLVSASDAVVGKVGYSTVAEVYHAGRRFGYITRPHFREAEVLARFVRRKMTGMAIEEETFRSGAWTEMIPQLLQLPQAPPGESNGADQVAQFLLGRT